MEAELVARITDCLAKGGLFNMEVTEAGKVTDLLIDCRRALSLPAASPADKSKLIASFDKVIPDFARERVLAEAEWGFDFAKERIPYKEMDLYRQHIKQIEGGH